MVSSSQADTKYIYLEELSNWLHQTSLQSDLWDILLIESNTTLCKQL